MNSKISEVENKILNSSSLLTTAFLNTKPSEVENKIHDHTKYITIQKFSSRKFAARLKEDNLVTKTNFDNKLISFNRKITSNKTKYLEVQKS